MPQQHPVAVVQEATRLRVLGDGERLQQLQVVARVGAAVGGLQVLLQRLTEIGRQNGVWLVN